MFQDALFWDDCVPRSISLLRAGFGLTSASAGRASRDRAQRRQDPQEPIGHQCCCVLPQKDAEGGAEKCPSLLRETKPISEMSAERTSPGKAGLLLRG